jgi:transposase
MFAYRTEAWEQHQKPSSLYKTNLLLLWWKQESPALSLVHSQVLQNIQERVAYPYKAFFRQAKTSETSNCPQKVQQLVNTYSAVAVEDLQICNMVRNGSLGKSIVDVAWRQFSSILTCKAAWADWQVIVIDLTRLRKCLRGVDCVPKSPLNMSTSVSRLCPRYGKGL